MFKCYSQSCNNQISEEYTYCSSCKDKFYPPNSKDSIKSIQKRLRQLSKTAKPSTEQLVKDYIL